jgi:cold-inducible RNA-binding protein
MNKFLLCKLSHSALLTPSDLSTNLYLKPLPPTMTEDDLYKVFCKFGPIDAAKVMVDKLTGKSLQIGFVRFQHQKDATTALNTMNGEKLERDQPPLSVKYAENNWQRTARKSRNQTNASGIAELMNSSNISNISTISTFSNISNSPNLSNSPNFSHSLISPPMSPTYYYPPQMLYAPVQYLPVNYNYYISVAPQIDQYIPQWSSPAYYMTEQT